MSILFSIVIPFIVGLVLFPILFFFQRLFKLAPPDLTKTSFHIHHSFYGLSLVIIGFLILSMMKNILGLYVAAFGLGFIVHHEISEPGLKGIEKFIHVKKKE